MRRPKWNSTKSTIRCSKRSTVCARAYGVEVSATGQYPAVAEREQTKLRTIIRTERRMELAFEQLRYLDLYRWRIAEKVMNYPNYGLPAKNKARQDAYMQYWFHGAVPEIDESGCPDFSRTVKGEPSFFRVAGQQTIAEAVHRPPKCTCGRSRTKLLRSCPISKTIPDIDPFPNDENRRPGTDVPGLFVYTDAHAIRHMPVRSDRIYRADNRLTAPSSFFAYGP